ncbi:MAG: polyphosphate polymerase domain-containing protein [Faecousia sp.]
MAIQTVFKRYEMKYLMTLAQKERILEAMKPYMTLDRYGRTTIRNIYYDTDRYLLARRSIEKPVYKEKLRICSYGQAKQDTMVFVELKKKYESVVYKRRISLPEEEAMKWVAGVGDCPKRTQIAAEVDYLLSFYKSLRPAVFLSYEREAFFANDGSDFRVTFDDTILCREENLSLRSEVYGTPILPPETVLMELKCSGGIPMWMTRILSEEHIYKTSYSKYGVAYQTILYPRLCREESQKAAYPEVILPHYVSVAANHSLEVAYHA